MAKKDSRKKNTVSLNKKAGSLAYNRLDMQVSQTLHMAIELYPNLNYLFVLDHYDDITLFDCERLYTLLPTKNPIYNNTYISILIASVLINEWRRMQ